MRNLLLYFKKKCFILPCYCCSSPCMWFEKKIILITKFIHEFTPIACFLLKKNPKLIRSEMYTFVLSFCPNYLLYTYSIDLYMYTCSSSSETHNVERNEAYYSILEPWVSAIMPIKFILNSCKNELETFSNLKNLFWKIFDT